MENIKSQVITDFIPVAADFCQLMEQASKKRSGELFSSLQQLLPEIYLKASRLPKPKYCYEEEPKKFVREDDYAAIHDALQQKVELVNGIARMSPGTRPSQHELVSFSLAELLADIYEELKNFIKLYEVDIPQAMNDAVWLCRKSYEQGFGIKLVEALKLLHGVMYNKDTEGSRAVKSDDFDQTLVDDEDEPWYSDEQEEVYGDDE
jgi:hypothetical protein